MSFIDILKQLDCDLYENEPLSKHTTFKIGGPAKYFAVPRSMDALSKLIAAARDNGVNFVVLGRGSNVLATDEGYDGLVICLTQKYAAITVDGDTLYADAGASLARICKITLDNNLSGLEFAWGIPGSVGGAIYMNAGAYGGEMKDVVDSVVYLDGEDDYKIKTLSADQCDFSYRHSFFSGKAHVICGVNFKLQRGSREEIKEKMDDLLNRRVTKQPYFIPSAGSTFKRPEGSYASMLVDQCGLKGHAVGDAEVSPKHAGFVVNNGSASCADVLQLCEEIIAVVKEKTGFVLEREVKILGE